MVRVAIVQEAPRYLDLEGTLALTEKRMQEAADRGAQLVVFGETWLCGYPVWLDYCRDVAMWGHEPTKEVYAAIRRSSIEVPGPHTALLAELSRKYNVILVLGANERIAEGPGNKTLYNALLTFDPERGLVNHHRKLVATYTERMVWGSGDPRGLATVKTPLGRISGLICWEHWMPLARQALHEFGEDIHIAVWPTVIETHQIASRHYAFEGRCFVLAAGTLTRVRDLPERLELTPELKDQPDRLLLRGGSAIYGPDGTALVGPLMDEATILIEDLDLERIVQEQMTLDTTGHYARPDIFDFKLRKT